MMPSSLIGNAFGNCRGVFGGLNGENCMHLLRDIIARTMMTSESVSYLAKHSTDLYVRLTDDTCVYFGFLVHHTGNVFCLVGQ